MAKGFKAGAGGGAPLNFKVVGNPQPSNPKVNTIWVNTDVPISKWHFDVNQPENMAEGDVWFSTGTISSVAFNALKKNGIQVYPLSAKQYVGGVLVDVEAKSYQNGRWVEWSREYYLFKAGEGATVQPSVSKGSATSVTITNNSIVKTGTGSSDGEWATIKFNDVDLTLYRTLYFEVKCTNKGHENNYAYQYAGDKAVKTFWKANSTRTIYECDISNLSGKQLVACTGDGAAYTIYNIWLEM